MMVETQLLWYVVRSHAFDSLISFSGNGPETNGSNLTAISEIKHGCDSPKYIKLDNHSVHNKYSQDNVKHIDELYRQIKEYKVSYQKY